MSLIRGKRSARLQQEGIEESRATVQSQIRVLKGRVSDLLRAMANDHL